MHLHITTAVMLVWNLTFHHNNKAADCFEMLGKHTPSSLGTTVLGGKFPHPAVMYNHFLKPGKPLQMKHVLRETDYPAFTQWTDEYLKHHFEEEEIIILMGDPLKLTGMTMSHFIEEYQYSGFATWDDMPEKMRAETLIPPVLQCGGIQHNLHNPGLFFSSGGDKTLLQYNNVDYLTCVLDGRQEFVLYDKKYKDQIEADGWVEDGGYSLVNVEDVDKRKFPGLYSAPWQKATVSKGDCLLVPYGWYSHISTPFERTLAIELKFSHLWWFDKEDCDSIDKNVSLKPISEFNVLDDTGELRTVLLAPFSNRSSISREIFRQVIKCGSTQLTEQFWSYIDGNSDGSLSWKELYNFDMNYDQNKFSSCYRNLKRVEKDQKLILNSRRKAHDNIQRPSGKTRTKVAVEDQKQKKKIGKDPHVRGIDKSVKSRGDFKAVKGADEGKHKHDEF